jgi:hypothetical protein
MKIYDVVSLGRLSVAEDGGGNALRAGANLAPERAVGHRTWEDFLAERVPDEA